MRKQNLILFISLCITLTSRTMDLLTAIDNKIGYVAPKLNPYDLTQTPEWSWPQKGTSHSGMTIYDRAGVLPFAWYKGTVYILLGYETAKEIWTDFTGSADKTDASPLQTAAREFAEESNIVFYKAAKGKKLTDKYGHKDIQEATRNMLEPKQKTTQGPMVRGVSRGIKPLDQWMYFVEVPYIPAQELNKSARGPGSEMSEFRWISVKDLLRILSTAKKFEGTIKPFTTSSKTLYKYFLNTLLRNNALLFLKDLYKKQLDLSKKQPLEEAPLREKTVSWSPNVIDALELLHDSLYRLAQTLS